MYRIGNFLDKFSVIILRKRTDATVIYRQCHGSMMLAQRCHQIIFIVSIENLCHTTAIWYPRKVSVVARMHITSKWLLLPTGIWLGFREKVIIRRRGSIFFPTSILASFRVSKRAEHSSREVKRLIQIASFTRLVVFHFSIRLSSSFAGFWWHEFFSPPLRSPDRKISSGICISAGW